MTPILAVESAVIAIRVSKGKETQKGTAADAPHSSFVTTADSVRLRHTQQGPPSTPALVFIAGWAQTAAQFREQAARLRVNHVRPPRPQRLRQARVRVPRRAPTPPTSTCATPPPSSAAHSMGASTPAMTADPAWPPPDRSAVFPAGRRFELAAREALSRRFLPSADPADRAWALAQQAKTPAPLAADWRHVLPRIDAVERVSRSRSPARGSRVFEKHEGGSHFVFWGNPDKFNRVLEEFLES
ncbi:alpha/beta-hydrolase [Durotheca rogersii]|uniref:alpha/beta-hydrolase n=1 Tax=Durotheca rogersii TaxID=419775 RepID=UPI002220FA79|nr:alpha/beta-hydrolase [Durotheca rogersii]KAI5861085.1 alpha/beta-hydrolase [Durotheca rogersii]